MSGESEPSLPRILGIGAHFETLDLISLEKS